MESEVQNVKTRRDRPAGVSNVATWLILSGVVSLLFYGIPLIQQFSKGGSFSLGVANGLIGILLAVIALAVAWGLWTLRPWAVQWTIGLLAINVLSRIIGILIAQATSNIVIQVLSILLNVWIIYYLATSKTVREAYKP